MQLLISDTNIIIDLDVCELLEQMFQLPFSFAVPDVLYLEELEEQHGNLPGFGLQVLPLSSESINSAIELRAKYLDTGENDLFALTLAKQEECPLLTGDQALRIAAKEENVELKGTIWIIQQLIEHGSLNCDNASEAFDTMKANGRRLPWKKAEQMIASLR